jgi:hypothetical protein
MNNTVAKLWNGRKIMSEQTFHKPEGQTFGAYHAACKWASDNGYSDGSMDAGPKHNPIALVKGEYNLPQKWHNFTKEDKQKCDGVMIAYDWREGDVRVILFAEKTLL